MRRGTSTGSSSCPNKERLLLRRRYRQRHTQNPLSWPPSKAAIQGHRTRVSRKKYQPACKPGSVWSCLRDGHSSGTPVASRLMQSTRVSSVMTRLASAVARSARPPLFDLAPGGVCPAMSVARRAVRSYRTFSPLLAPPFGLWHSRPLRACRAVAALAAKASGIFSVALSLGSPPAAVSRHRVIKEPGLSSTGRFCLLAF